MPRTTGFLPTLATVAGACLGAAPAMANDDTQFWHFSTLTIPVGEDGRVLLELSPRAREGSIGDEQLLSRTTYEHQLNKTVSIGGGAAFASAVGPDEIRPHQQVTLTFGPLQARTRVEERFFHGADRMALRLRQRLQLSTRAFPDTTVTGSAEVLYNARTQTAGMVEGVDSWRARIAVEQQLSRHLQVGAAYLLLLSPRGEREDQWSHVPQIVLNWRL